MYNIYHIPEFVYSDGSIGKIGVSNNVKQRMKQQGYTIKDVEVLEEHTDIYEVSNREQELQKQYGYRVDTIPYWKTIKNGLKQSIQSKQRVAKNMSKGLTKEQRSKGSKLTYKTNKESGHMAKFHKMGGKAAGKIHAESGHMDKMRELSIIASRKPILQYDKDGKFIKEWISISECGRALIYDISSIAKVCKGKQKTAKGFVFKYKE